MKKRLLSFFMCVLLIVTSVSAYLCAFAEQAEQPAQQVVSEPPAATPEPATPEPATPEPATPEPATPEPATPEPATPEPATPEPATPEPATEAPVTEAPVTEAPVTEAPVTEAPVTEAPVTEAPVTEAPVTEAPVTEAPVTEAPVTEAPVTEAPVTEAPVTEAPVTEAPEEKPFQEGYVFIKSGTALYVDIEDTEVLGEFAKDTAAYAWVAREDADPLRSWLEVAFDTQALREADEPTLKGYLRLGEVLPLAEQETLQLLDDLRKDAETREYRNQMLPCAEFELAKVEAGIEIEPLPSVEPTEDPEAGQEEAPYVDSPAETLLQGTISASRVNVRAQASTDSPVVAVKEQGETVAITGESDGLDGCLWYSVSFDSVSGYIRSDLLEVMEPVEETEMPLANMIIMAEDLLLEATPLELRALPVPTLEKAEQSTTSSVSLEWESVEGVDGYAIWYREASGEYMVYKYVGATATQAEVTGLTSGKTYYFKVSAYAGTEDAPENGELSNVKGVTLGLPAPTFERLKQNGTDKVDLVWTKVEGASGYSVYRREDSESVYKYVGGTQSSADVELTISGGLTLGKTYHYKVRAYEMIDGEKVLSPNYSKVKSITIGVPGPEWESATQTGKDKVELVWKPVEGADGYSVYRATSANGVYSYAGGTSSQTAVRLTVTGLTNGTTYYFKVRAFEIKDGQKVLSPQYSEVYEVTVGAMAYGDFLYEYDADGTGIVVAAYLGNASTVEVPASIDGTPIVEIGEGAFEGNSTLVSVDLPDSVEIIGVRAFAGCTALNSMQ